MFSFYNLTSGCYNITWLLVLLLRPRPPHVMTYLASCSCSTTSTSACYNITWLLFLDLRPRPPHVIIYLASFSCSTTSTSACFNITWLLVLDLRPRPPHVIEQSLQEDQEDQLHISISFNNNNSSNKVIMYFTHLFFNKGWQFCSILDHLFCYGKYHVNHYFMCKRV